MIRKGFIFLSLVATGVILYSFLVDFNEKLALPEVSSHYIQKGPSELGAANIVTAVVVTYRGLDTLGEVTILFAAASVVGLLLTLNGGRSEVRREGSELLKTASKFLFPLITLFGVYVFINGHLTPGGGFQGGAIIASGIVLTVLANPNREFGHTVLSVVESVSGFTYVAVAALGVVMAGGFLDNHLLPLGKYGTLFSAGLIPVIYSLVGLKVGSELGSVVVTLGGNENSEEEGTK